MRFLPLLFLSMVLAACSAAPVTSGASEAASPDPQETSIDSVVQFLITAAATDFHTHRPPDPVRFRHVRVGHALTPSGGKQYLLCGEFLPAQGGGSAEWNSFTTIKTSSYEQWLGDQANGLCLRASVIWHEGDDLAPLLQSRLDSMR